MNAVIFDAVLSIFLGLLVFAGSQAVNAVFALSTVGLYYAYSVPIAARFMGGNKLKPGPFNLGILVSEVTVILRGSDSRTSTERACCIYRCSIYGIHVCRLLIPFVPNNRRRNHELHCPRFRRRNGAVTHLVLLSEVWRRLLVYWAHQEY